MNFAIGGKKGKKRGPAAAFNVATEEDEAKTRALAVQRQRASEMGFDAPAASSRPAKAAAAASSAPAAKAAKKAVDYSHLMGEAPTECASQQQQYAQNSCRRVAALPPTARL